MSRPAVTVAIPVLNGGELLVEALAAIRAQQVEADVELLICDSGSTDGSPDRAREHGARVIEIERSAFGHGATRNLLMSQATGSHVALLTQDAVPRDEHWLETLLSGFQQADDVALVFGPYVARPAASKRVRSELERWFESLDVGPERLAEDEGEIPAIALMGRRGFFSDANAAIARAAWQRVPFRDIPYAEDRALALDMLRAGFAKVYEPRAAVWHSHTYRATDQFRRAFDESRGLHEVYGWSAPAGPRYLLGQVRGELGALRREGAGPLTLTVAARDQTARVLGSVLGTRATLLPAWLQRRCSLERRATGPSRGDRRA